MLPVPVNEIDIYPVSGSVCPDMIDDIIFLSGDEVRIAVFGGPHAVEPDFYVWHGGGISKRYFEVDRCSPTIRVCPRSSPPFKAE
jgi:hypothetical protein